MINFLQKKCQQRNISNEIENEIWNRKKQTLRIIQVIPEKLERFVAWLNKNKETIPTQTVWNHLYESKCYVKSKVDWFLGETQSLTWLRVRNVLSANDFK